ncbi:hypothetical protein [Paracidovorax sp. MALMAid1276]
MNVISMAPLRNSKVGLKKQGTRPAKAQSALAPVAALQAKG